MMPYEDSTLISLVLACCEDPTHPIEPLSDWIQEQGYKPPDPDYTDPNWEFWYEVLERKAYRAGCENRTWHQLLGQLRDLGTWDWHLGGNGMSKDKRKEIQEEDQKRAKASLFLSGWETGVHMNSIPPERESDSDWMAGWKAGRQARQKAIEEAETKYGFKYARIKAL